VDTHPPGIRDISKVSPQQESISGRRETAQIEPAAARAPAPAFSGGSLEQAQAW
jgi:hypothetical protein